MSNFYRYYLNINELDRNYFKVRDRHLDWSVLSLILFHFSPVSGIRCTLCCPKWSGYWSVKCFHNDAPDSCVQEDHYSYSSTLYTHFLTTYSDTLMFFRHITWINHSLFWVRILAHPQSLFYMIQISSDLLSISLSNTRRSLILLLLIKIVFSYCGSLCLIHLDINQILIAPDFLLLDVDCATKIFDQTNKENSYIILFPFS